MMSHKELEDAITKALEEEAVQQKWVEEEKRAIAIRKFKSGATRDTAEGKLEPWGFLSPLALHRFSEYMHKHRKQADGSLRSSDNWKKGIPIDVYLHSLMRHVFDFWLVMTGFKPRFDKKVEDPVEIACAIMFNVQGFLHEALSKGLDNQINETKPEPIFGWPKGEVPVLIDSHKEFQKSSEGLWDPAELLKTL